MSFIEFFDNMSEEPRLFIKSKKRYSTKLGASMTILTYILTFVYAVYSLIIFMDGAGVNIISYKKPLQNTYKVSFKDIPILFAVNFNNYDVNDLRFFERIFSFEVIYNYNYSLPLKTQSFSKSAFKNNSKYISQFHSYHDFFTTISFEEYDDLYLNITSDINEYSTLMIKIKTCENSTEKSNCLPQEYIDKYLNDNDKNILFSFITGENYIQPLNSTNPLGYNLFENVYKLEPKMSNFLSFYYKITDFETDEGILFKNIKKSIALQKDLLFTEKMINASVWNPILNPYILEFNIKLNNRELDYYSRTYPKLSSVAAGIQSISNLIFYLTSYISLIFSDHLLDIDLFNSTIKFNRCPDKFPDKNQNVSFSDITNKFTIEKNVLKTNNSTILKPLPISKRKKILNDSLRPTCLTFEKTRKLELIQCKDLYFKLLSVETISEWILEVDKLKRMLFQKDNLIAYENIDIYSSNTELFQYWIEDKKIFPNMDLKNINASEDCFSKILYQYYNK
jgi:hypothetical protein